MPLFAFIDFYLLNIKIVHCIKNTIINYACIDAHALATSANSWRLKVSPLR